MLTAFLNLDTGNLVLDSSEHVLKAELPLTEFLSWQLPSETRKGHPGCPECDIELNEEVEIGDGRFYVYLIFENSRLIKIALRNADAEYKHSHVFSWDIEKACRKAHADWLARYAEGKTGWTWGRISSYYDEAGWGAVIFIDYFAKAKEV